jgi:hypothetical protein
LGEKWNIVGPKEGWKLIEGVPEETKAPYKVKGGSTRLRKYQIV